MVKSLNNKNMIPCTQADRLERIEHLLVGNGHPEDGYVYKVLEINSTIKEMNERMTAVSGIVKELHEDSIRTKTKDKFKDITFGKVITLITALVGLIMMWQGFKALNTKVDNFGTPVIINSRGEITKLPYGDSLRYFRDGEYQDSYKDSI